MRSLSWAWETATGKRRNECRDNEARRQRRIDLLGCVWSDCFEYRKKSWDFPGTCIFVTLLFSAERVARPFVYPKEHLNFLFCFLLLFVLTVCGCDPPLSSRLPLTQGIKNTRARRGRGKETSKNLFYVTQAPKCGRRGDPEVKKSSNVERLYVRLLSES